MTEAAKRIKLHIEEPAGIARQAWPVTQGVPFADGELERGAPVRMVDAAGKVLPAQVIGLTTWDEDLRYVKWLLVDFQVDLAAGENREVFLEYGAGVTSAQPAQPVRLEETHKAGFLPEEKLTIDTGVLRCEFSRWRPDFLTALQIKAGKGWRNLLPAGKTLQLFMTDQRGVKYDSSRAAPAPVIAVEDQGPLRTALCIKGFHASADGRRFCPYILRLHFYAGKADIRLHHTFIFDQDPERLELKEIGLRLPLKLGPEIQAAFAEGSASAIQDFKYCQSLQGSDLDYRIIQDGEIIAHADRTRGWGYLQGDKVSVLAAIRDMWQEYPKSIAFNRQGIEIQVWPAACGETLKFSTPFKTEPLFFEKDTLGDEAAFRRQVEARPEAPLSLKSLDAGTREELLWVEEMVAKYAPGRPATYNDIGVGNGFGAAKTTECWLRFSSRRIDDGEAEAFGASVQEPLLAPAELSHTCATDALRLVCPFDPERFPEVEAALESIFEQVVLEPRRALRNYGLIDYGDLMCSHSRSPWPMWQLFKDSPDVIEKMKHCSRAYNNEANDQVYAVWGFYTHTNRRDYFLAAEAYGRHVADVDIIHANPDGSPPGLVHYHNAHHWSGMGAPSHTCTAGLMLQYYLTGNRRLLEVCRETAEWAMLNQEAVGIFRNRDMQGAREFTTPVHNLLEFYQATWERRYGEVARRSLKWLMLLMPEPGCFPESVFTSGERGDAAEVMQVGWTLCQVGGMTPQLLHDAVRAFGKKDPIFQDALMGLAHRYLWGMDSPELTVLRVGPKQVQLQNPYMKIGRAHV